MEWLSLDSFIKALEPLGGARFIGVLLFLLMIFFLDRVFKERAALVDEYAKSRAESAKLMGNHLVHLEKAQGDANEHFIASQNKMTEAISQANSNSERMIESLKIIASRLDEVWKKS